VVGPAEERQEVGSVSLSPSRGGLTLPTIQKSGSIDEDMAPVTHNFAFDVDLDLVFT
jgi:hypothetical protein